MNISIVQGRDRSLPAADINVVIDVIRAFTVAHLAFLQGVSQIVLANSIENAWELKRLHPDHRLAGEVQGLPVKGFELDNSPARILDTDLQDAGLIQKTTNGVQATFHSLHAAEVLVTGFTNARTTALHIRRQIEHSPDKNWRVHLIATHPSGDDDLACAEYMRGIITDHNMLPVAAVRNRIRQSEAAKKFFDPLQAEFDPRDIDLCMRELDSSFVMRIRPGHLPPTVERRPA